VLYYFLSLPLTQYVTYTHYSTTQPFAEGFIDLVAQTIHIFINDIGPASNDSSD
jgi:hypothetical protein